MWSLHGKSWKKGGTLNCLCIFVYFTAVSVYVLIRAVVISRLRRNTFFFLFKVNTSCLAGAISRNTGTDAVPAVQLTAKAQAGGKHGGYFCCHLACRALAAHEDHLRPENTRPEQPAAGRGRGHSPPALWQHTNTFGASEPPAPRQGSPGPGVCSRGPAPP